VAPRAEHREKIVVPAKQAVGRRAHHGHVLGIGAHAAQDAIHRLDEERRLDEPLVDKVREVVEMAEVVAFELEARAMIAEFEHDALDVAEGVPEDHVLHPLHIILLPAIAPGRNLLRERMDREVHRSHVQRAHFGLQETRIREALVERHARAAARRDVDDGVGGRGDIGHEFGEHAGVRRGPAVFGIARVQMDDRGARLCRFDGLIADRSGRERQVPGHRRHVGRARHGALNDDFSAGGAHPDFLVRYGRVGACGARARHRRRADIEA